MAKKNESSTPATEIKPADLVAENIPPASEIAAAPAVDSGGNSVGSVLAGEAKGDSPEKPQENNPPENSQPVATPAEPSATVVTADQLVSEQIPPATPNLPPTPGQTGPKRGRGRPSIPFPECKKCGRKHKLGLCVSENSASQINISPGESLPGSDEPLHDNPIEEKPAVNYRQLAEVCFDLSTNTAAALIGPEWRSEEKEREGMLMPLEMYLRSKDVQDIPPGAILCFAIAGYVAVRLRAPNTRSKISLAWAWVKSKVGGTKKQFAPKPVKPGNPFSENSFQE